MPVSRVELSLPAWVDELAPLGHVCADEDERVALAIALARENVERGDGGPFGAAVFECGSGRLVAAGVNSVLRLRNSVLHAEITALMRAEAQLRSHTLRVPGRPAHGLYSSCAPCAMCLGAVLWAGVERVVSAATREDALAIGFEEGPVFPESVAYLERRGITVVGGLRGEEGRAVLERYLEAGGAVYNP